MPEIENGTIRPEALIRSPDSESLVNAVTTTADTQSLSSFRENRRNSEEWEKVIDRKLIEWAVHPEQFDDDEVEPPARLAIQKAFELAQTYRDAGHVPPTRVVPDANGGVAFEHQQGDALVSVRVSDKGAVEYLRFQGSRLVERYSL